MTKSVMTSGKFDTAKQYLAKIPLGKSLIGQYRSGIPFPRGLLKKPSQSLLVTDSNEILDFFISPLSKWDDGSYRWCLVGIDLKAVSDVSLIIYAEPQLLECQHSTVTALNDIAECVVGEFSKGQQLSVSRTKLSFSLSCIGTRPVEGVFEFKTNDENIWLTVTDNVEQIPYLNPNTQLPTAFEIVSNGKFQHPSSEREVLFEARWFVYSGSENIELSVTLHNPRAAKHPDGLWDLGDENAVRFDDFSLILTMPEGCRASYQLDSVINWQTAEQLPLRIEQFASGGENWRSPVHVDKDNNVPLERNGFSVNEGSNSVKEGDRVNPMVSLAGDHANLTLYPHLFWQNFPKSLDFDGHSLRYDFFPSTTYDHELQAGEKKTHKVILGLTKECDLRNAPAKRFELSGAWLKQTGVVPFYTDNKIETDELVQGSITGANSFTVKRETVDEYGWRNFGDLYADHETAGYQGNDIFVSHYNNQYDPLYGFLKQYLVTNDSRWLELSSDLAQHVKDIDIYHTDEDKHEYNGGLFWHTDHYVKACTATHRSFSRLQDTGVYEDHAGGGGPGGQHCYTTGLMLHYFLTGEKSSLQAVVTLTGWIENFYDGRGTMFEWLLALKNRHAIDLKNHFNEQYPLDRGTGHLLVAFIDSYEVTNDPVYLEKAAKVIRHTIAPHENVNDRELDDVERRWFYTVLLQGVYRYLSVKEQLFQFDDDFYYARDSLLNFADWMVDNEYPYLEKPELLEFPNDTWTAQDLRKACVLSAAYYFSNGSVDAYKQKAEFFRDYVVSQLNDSAEVQYTRIQVLLLQNKGVTAHFLTKQSESTFSEVGRYSFEPGYKNKSLWQGALCSFFSRLVRFSFADESRWLKSRIN